MDFLTKLFDSFIKFFKSTTPVVKVEDEQVAKAAEVNAVAEVGSVEVKAEPAKKAPAKKAPAKKAPKSPAKAEVAEKRVRKNGKFVGDDKSTPDVNEAFKDGKAPAKKASKKKPPLKVEK